MAEKPSIGATPAIERAPSHSGSCRLQARGLSDQPCSERLGQWRAVRKSPALARPWLSAIAPPAAGERITSPICARVLQASRRLASSTTRAYTTPSAALARAIGVSSAVTLGLSCSSRSKGRAPALTTTPESRADTSAGASAWVRGSHSPLRKTPDLVSSPTSTRARGAPGGRAARAANWKLPLWEYTRAAPIRYSPMAVLLIRR